MVFVNLPVPSELTGRVQSGRRPGVILNATEQLDSIPVVLIVPGTTNLRAAMYPYTVRVVPSRSNGLRSETIFLGSHLQAVDRRLVEFPKLGALEERDLRLTENAVLEALGFESPAD